MKLSFKKNAFFLPQIVLINIIVENAEKKNFQLSLKKKKMKLKFMKKGEQTFFRKAIKI